MRPGVFGLVDEGLGNSAYLVDLGDGRALAVDASLDLRAMRAAAERRGLRVAFAADTHLHADFLSGARQLAADDGATVLASAAGRRHFDHARLEDGDEVDLGGLRLRTIATPGHTDEHVSFALLDGDRPQGVFTGGSLIVGSAARTDLVSPERTEELASSTGLYGGSPPSTTRSRFGRPMARARSARPRPMGAACRLSARSSGRIPCSRRQTRTPSCGVCSARAARSRRTSCGWAS